MVVCGTQLPIAVQGWASPLTVGPLHLISFSVFSFLFSIFASKYHIGLLVTFFLKQQSLESVMIFFKLVYSLASAVVILNPGCMVQSPGEFAENAHAQAHPQQVQFHCLKWSLA